MLRGLGVAARAPGAHRQEKAHAAELTARVLDKAFPGSASKVEPVDVATPFTTYRYKRDWQGSLMGWAEHREDDEAHGAHPARPLGALHGGAVGAARGGVPSRLSQGRQMAQILCHQDGRRFAPPAQPLQ